MNILFPKFNIIVILKLSQNWKHYWAIRNERKTKYELVVAYTQAYMKTKLPFHDEIQYNYVQRKNNFEYLFRQWKKKKKKNIRHWHLILCSPILQKYPFPMICAHGWTIIAKMCCETDHKSYKDILLWNK